MREEAIDSWLLGLIALLVALLLWRIIAGGSRRIRKVGLMNVPPGTTLKSQPLFSDRELSLYNLLRMAVQDRYLVFAQVPLWRIVAVEGESRLQVLRHLALKRADFVLVHPGSKVVEQVVQLEDDASVDLAGRTGNRDIQRVMQAAGIKVTTLNSQSTYTVRELEELLGLGEAE